RGGTSRWRMTRNRRATAAEMDRGASLTGFDRTDRPRPYLSCTGQWPRSEGRRAAQRSRRRRTRRPPGQGVRWASALHRLLLEGFVLGNGDRTGVLELVELLDLVCRRQAHRSRL